MSENIINKIRITDVEYVLQDQAATNAIQGIHQELTEKVNANMFFVGTYAEYEAANANGDIPINAIVIITDDATQGGVNAGATSAILGTGKLGYMILA